MPHLPQVARVASRTLARLQKAVPAWEPAPNPSSAADDRKAIAELALAHKHLLLMPGGAVDAKSEAGKSACAKFLEMLALVSQRLSCDAADRSYRRDFTCNYQMIFPDRARRYRPDILEAATGRLDTFWVNGDQFRLSSEVLGAGEELQAAWQSLSDLLQQPPGATSEDYVEAVREELSDFDFAWAGFEQRYISELIRIERKARRVILEASVQEEKLRFAELEHGRASPQYREAQQVLVRAVARLNAVANVRRKGRDDMGAEVLEAAHEIQVAASTATPGDERERAARIIAGLVVDAFAGMREYVRTAGRCIERVDPYLGNNPGLVEKLVSWEESWELGRRYLRNPALLQALCHTVAGLRAVKRAHSRFASMSEDCDAELFMVLPRLLWLGFLRDAAGQLELLRSVLPGSFLGEHSAGRLGPELEGFMSRFLLLQALLLDELSGTQADEGKAAVEDDVQTLLTTRAIVGVAESSLYRGLSTEAQKSAEDFMRDLEGWSMRLQRHCPDDWNQCSAVLLRCLGEVAPPQPQGKKKASFRM